MKFFKWIIILLVLGACSLLKNSTSLPSKHYYRYGVKSGHLVYTLKGIKQGTEELFFDQYGYRQVKYTKIYFKIGTSIKELSSITLYRNDSVYMLNLKDSSIQKYSEDYLYKKAKNLNSLNLGDAQIALLIKEQGMQKKGSIRFLNKDCRVYANADSSNVIWFWKNIPLYSKSKLLNVSNEQKAIRIQIELDIPESKFKLPTK